VPLESLFKGIGISKDFPIKGGASGGENRGICTIKITVVDPSKSMELTKGKMMKDIKSTEKNTYNSQFEKNIIMHIAMRLSKLSIDVELMFGIFSRGQRSCTREDFKYCCLHRLDLKNKISERELEMLLDNKLGNK